MTPPAPASFRHVNFLWDDAHAAGLDPVARLVYRSKRHVIPQWLGDKPPYAA